MDGLVWFLCCYGFPIFLLLVSAPVSTMMPWASAKYSHEYYGKIKDDELRAEKRKPFMSLARYSALIIGIALLAISLAINVWAPIAVGAKNIICLSLGVIAFIVWLVWDKKQSENREV